MGVWGVCGEGVGCMEMGCGGVCWDAGCVGRCVKALYCPIMDKAMDGHF